MGRLICVSNRVMTPQQTNTSGGLAVALSSALKQCGGVWMGWSGRISDETQLSVEDGAFTSVTLDMTQAEYDGGYLGYSNSVLWPVFHNRLDLARFDPTFFEAYVSFSARLADAIAQRVQPNDTIWVHDYHFVLLGQQLRARGVANPIGFFLHIPMPPPEAFLALPEYRTLGAALAAFDLVGLQTTSDVSNAIGCLRRSNGAQLLPSGRVSIDGARFALTRAPVTIDATDFAPAGPLVRSATVRRVLGVDRLDYTKGLPQKFRGFARLLERYPHFRKTTVLAQIAAPTRDSVEVYADIRQELEGISGAVNGAYGDVEWVPIHYVHRAVPRRKLGALYRSAAVGLITPLRDGMNLTAKEYVASQDASDPGVLVLSSFAGAAEDMEAALLVNPYCVDSIAEALAVALTMPLADRVARHRALMAVVGARDSQMWACDFVRQLGRAARINRGAPAVSVA
ncbi:MAG: hypothetical protein B7Y80_16610 [Hyphomicrobium sp. 32-62-53]|nr:MAG: hypothetical protein B7Z29_18660 [Hyphomicrobium sp. 12-62-95]OYX98214.1 MAG: hypothetical protein B7Y80_16610 [Hyphomicrobium sp. 32-62-53]